MRKKSRKTKQKEIIGKAIHDSNSFFTAEELFKKVKKKDPNIGIATIYRYLNDLSNQNKIFTYVCDRRKLYSNEQKSHCHFTCEKSGKTFHFDIDSLDFLKKVKEKIPGTITSFQLEVKGICEDCHKN